MATITIRNVPDSLLAKLKERAKHERRSVNNEIIKILEDAETRQKKGSLMEFLEKNEFDDDFIRNVEDVYKNRSYGREFNF